MKIIVTGAAGFIGSHTAGRLLSEGHEVVGIDNFNDYYSPKVKEHNVALLEKEFGDAFKIYRTELCENDSVREIFEKECRGDFAICHLAARAGVRASIDDPVTYTRANLDATTVLLDLARKFGAKNFVFASSSSVYGEDSAIPFREDQPLEHPISPYAATKKACELMAYTFNHLYGLQVSGLRFFTVYGPAGRPDMSPFLFTKWILNGERIKLFGDGTQQRDFTYIDDIVSGVVAAINKPRDYEIYNLGNNKPVMILDFIKTIEDITARSAEIEFLPKRDGDVRITCANIGKAAKLLGYKPKTTVHEGLTKFVEWYKNNKHLYA